MLRDRNNSIVSAAVASLAECSSTHSLKDRIELCRRCLNEVVKLADEWSVGAVVAKGLPRSSPLRAEDLLSGPCVVARQLQLTIQTLTAIQERGKPALAAQPKKLASGQLSVSVFPATGLFDSLTFMGIRAAVRFQRDLEGAEIHGQLPKLAANDRFSRISTVLGAGNVSSIPATDSLNRIMFEGRRVILKLNPVNEYLDSIFERAFQPLINANLLRILKGGADIGEELIQHDSVDEVHITGAATTHDAIVWGRDAEERRRRLQANDPLLKKKVTSELGNVTPWIIVPGAYSDRQLNSQAQHVAASITNNASFNCLATKMIVTWPKWPEREKFLRLVKHYLSKTPQRPAYYPGAALRFERFAGFKPPLDGTQCLPWTLLEEQSIEVRPELFEEESFVCVCAETSLDAETPEKFLAKATEFVNERMSGTLCASITVSNEFRRRHFVDLERSLSSLRYGTVCVNQWSGIAYGLISPPWGAYPGATVGNVQSGVGNVHNTYLLDHVEKTVLEGPLVNFPTPIWFPSHRKAVDVANRLIQLYHRPSVLRLPPLFAAAITG